MDTKQNKFAFFENFKAMADKLPDDMRLKFYDALTDYAFFGKESDDPIINALVTGIKFSLDRVDGRANNGGNHNPYGCKGKQSETNDNQSQSILINSNQKKSIPLETETETETETRNGNKKQETEKYGELGNVRLTAEQHTQLSEKYSNIDEAIDVLDTWLGTSGSKFKNKNHYAYFKANSWVWERVNEQHKTGSVAESTKSEAQEFWERARKATEVRNDTTI